MGFIPVKTIRVPDATTAIGRVQPVGTRIYNDDDDAFYKLLSPSSEVDTITTLVSSGKVSKYINEAPIDDNQYSRKNKGWAKVDLEKTVSSLRDLFQPSMIRNIEHDAVNDLANETKFLISSIDTVNKIITLDQPLPYLGNPTGTNKIWALFYTPGVFVKITNFNYDDNELTYEDGVGTLAVGNDVQFYNPFRKMEMVSYSPLIDTNSSGFTSNYISCGGVWEHSDGTFRMIVNGKNNSNVNQFGFASSINLVDWVLEDEITAKYTGGVAPFDKSWCNGSSGISANNTPIKIEGIQELQYYQIVTAYGSDGLRHVGAIVMDEDFIVIKVSDTEIISPDYANTHGYAGAGASYYDGLYHVTSIVRAADYSDWVAIDMEMGDVLNGVVNETTLITGSSGDAAWNGSHVDGCAKIVYNGEVLTFVAGTGHRIATTPFTNIAGVLEDNRTFGLVTQENGVYTPFKANPVFSNPISGNYIWGDVQYWCTDHTSSNVAYIIHEGYLYLFMSMSGGADTYKIAGVKYDISK